MAEYLIAQLHFPLNEEPSCEQARSTSLSTHKKKKTLKNLLQQGLVIPTTVLPQKNNNMMSQRPM